MLARKLGLSDPRFQTHYMEAVQERVVEPIPLSVLPSNALATAFGESMRLKPELHSPIAFTCSLTAANGPVTRHRREARPVPLAQLIRGCPRTRPPSAAARRGQSNARRTMPRETLVDPSDLSVDDELRTASRVQPMMEDGRQPKCPGQRRARLFSRRRQNWYLLALYWFFNGLEL